MKLKSYSKYKDSGINWIGKVPEGWEVHKIKFKADINKKKLNEDANPNLKINYLDISNVDNQGNIHNIEEQYFEDAPSRARRIPKEKDTIVSTVRTYLKAVAYLEKIPENFIVSTGFAVLESHKDILPKYLYYSVTSEKFIQAVIAVSKGVAYPAINPPELGQIYFTIPKKEEQSQIAQYLDSKIFQINQTIEKDKQLIELLKEKRTALINHVVTKGLNPKAKMKNSGIDWIGEVPEGWDVHKIKHVTDVKISNIDKKSKQNETEVMLCNYTDVYYNEFIDKNINFMKATASYEQINKLSLNKGDIMITKDSETPDDIAVPAVVSEELNDVACGYHLALIRPNKKKIRGDYLLRLFQSKGVNTQFIIWALGVTRFGISTHPIKNSYILIPPKPEQIQIVQYLNKATSKIDQTINKIQDKITLMEEYKKSLIHHVVTGKVDVREVAT